MNLFKTPISKRLIIVLTLITYAVFAFMLTVTIPKTAKFAHGMDILDMKPTGYSLDYIYTLFNALGEEGRLFYLNVQLPVDFIYPLLFGITGWLTIRYLAKHWSSKFIKWFSFFPALAGLMDYSENISIIQLLHSYPELNPIQAMVTSIFSVLKSSFTTLYFTTLLILLISFFWSKKFKKADEKRS